MLSISPGLTEAACAGPEADSWFHNRQPPGSRQQEQPASHPRVWQDSRFTATPVRRTGRLLLGPVDEVRDWAVVQLHLRACSLACGLLAMW